MKNATRFYKENPKGVEIMCKAFEETRQEGALQKAIDTARNLIELGKLSLEEIARAVAFP